MRRPATTAASDFIENTTTPNEMLPCLKGSRRPRRIPVRRLPSAKAITHPKTSEDKKSFVLSFAHPFSPLSLRELYRKRQRQRTTSTNGLIATATPFDKDQRTKFNDRLYAICAPYYISTFMYDYEQVD